VAEGSLVCFVSGAESRRRVNGLQGRREDMTKRLGWSWIGDDTASFGRATRTSDVACSEAQASEGMEEGSDAIGRYIDRGRDSGPGSGRMSGLTLLLRSNQLVAHTTQPVKSPMIPPTPRWAGTTPLLPRRRATPKRRPRPSAGRPFHPSKYDPIT
jgi:hypothetical protein